MTIVTPPLLLYSNSSLAHLNHHLQRAFENEAVDRSHRTFHSRSFPKPFERIESLRPALRFRVPLGDGTYKLEVLR
jgi:hypothetical protein